MTPDERAIEDVFKEYEKATGTEKPNLWVRETHINVTEGHCIGEEPPYEAFTSDRGRLYRSLQGDYGKCVGAMHFDTKEGGKTIRNVGWIFQKRIQYEDTGYYGEKAEFYIHEVWVEIVEKRTVTREVEVEEFVPVGTGE